MKCFDHRNADAVGICKHCQRGVCAECSVLVGECVACRGRCEEEVARLNRIIDEAQTGTDSYRRTEQMLRSLSIWMAAGAGVTLLAATIVPADLVVVAVSLAGGLAVGSAFYAVQARRWRPRD